MGSHVAILLCTYNSGQYLGEQLGSFAAQTHTNWSLHVSDDGSTDDTQAFVNDFAAAHPGHTILAYPGPQKGFVQNFISLVCNPKVVADHYAYSDHDDIWLTDKLARAVAALATVPALTPALYCSSSALINAQGKAQGTSQCFAKKPGFANALVQCIAGGNTMVFNEAARQLLLKAGAEHALPSHDWWTYQLVTGAGGVVIYDPSPTIQYRQHGHNVIGANRGVWASLQRIQRLFSGQFRQWNTMNCLALTQVSPFFTTNNQARLCAFKEARQAPIIPRILGMWRSGIYRQTWLGNLGLAVAVLTNRI